MRRSATCCRRSPTAMLAAWIRERFGQDADGGNSAAWLVAAVGLGAEPGRPEETAWAARRLLAGLAHDRPLLIVLDDVHWAAPAFLDLVESLVELARAPVLVLCLARPDLLELRPHWGGGRLSSSSVLLDALTEAESDALLDRLASGQAARCRRHGSASSHVAEGNPLFIEQLLAAALEGDAEAVPGLDPDAPRGAARPAGRAPTARRAGSGGVRDVLHDGGGRGARRGGSLRRPC